MDRLPNEILDVILAQLAEKPLLQLSLVSRSMRALVKPCIYRDISLTLAPPFKKDKLPYTRVRDLFGALVETMANDCVAANSVRSLSINILTKRARRVFDDHERLTIHLRDLRSAHFSPPPSNLWLVHCTMLSHLSIDCKDSYLTKRRRDLTSVDVAGMLTRHMAMPSLRSLHANNVSCLGDPFEFSILEKDGVSHVTSLCFTQFFDYSPEGIQSLIKMCKALQNFAFEGRVEHREHGSSEEDPGLLPMSLASALHCHAASLLSLSITDEVLADYPIDCLLINAQNFHFLTRLAIPEAFLTRWDGDSLHELLPRNLEEIQLQYSMANQLQEEGIQKQQVRRLYYLAENKAQALPRLARLIWWHQEADFPRRPRYSFAKKLLGLTQVFNKIDVKFEVFTSPMWRDTPFATEDTVATGGYQYSRREYRGEDAFKGHWVEMPDAVENCPSPKASYLIKKRTWRAPHPSTSVVAQNTLLTAEDWESESSCSSNYSSSEDHEDGPDDYGFGYVGCYALWELGNNL